MIVAFTALHYGADYLAYAIRSVAPQVDKWVFAYSPHGSHGHRSHYKCPDSEDSLRAIAEAELGSKLLWHRGEWQAEGHQRDVVYELAPDADLIVVVDFDEVWHEDSLAAAIEQGLAMNARNGRVPFRHFWRSFNWVCADLAQPVRIINPRHAGGNAEIDMPAPVEHFGYARTPEAIIYKIAVHGHLGEWRHDWLPNKFLPWSPLTGPFEDLHPTNVDFWTARPFDKKALPELMHEHPYWDMEIIK